MIIHKYPYIYGYGPRMRIAMQTDDEFEKQICVLIDMIRCRYCLLDALLAGMADDNRMVLRCNHFCVDYHCEDTLCSPY